ncbi:MAG: type II toxin-antitoxin system VapC family toxin [Candidatus Limnocylindria bacterium]
MIVADTSAWVEFLRGTDHKVAARLRELIERDEDLAVTEVILMELLAGARSGTGVRELRSRLLGFKVLPLEGLADFEEAGVIYRACRDAGETLRSLSDCLIAVPVIRAGAVLLHNDADFAVIARHSSLRIA